MNPPLPPEIREESSREGPRYLLPDRGTGPLKLMAVCVLGIGCLQVGFALFWIFGVSGVSIKATPVTGNIVSALVGLPFLAIGLGIVALGVVALYGRCEIELWRAELVARERVGPFRWTRRIPTKDIRRFTLNSDTVLNHGQPEKSGPKRDIVVLKAEVGTAEPRFIVVGYPRVWTKALAARLAADLAEQTGAAPLPMATDEEEVYYRPRTDLRPGEVGGLGTRVVVHGDQFDPPAGTTLRIKEQAGGIVAVVPPQRVRSSLAFAILWLGLTGIIGWGITGGPETQKRHGIDTKGIPAEFFGVLGLIGFAELVGAVSRMRRKASLRASRGELIIVQQSFFGSETFKRDVGQLSTIGVGASGVEVNGVAVRELEVYDTNGERYGFFSNLTEVERLWLATHLRHATGLGEAPGKASEPPRLAM